jgi:lysophospholipase L1-like esterase
MNALPFVVLTCAVFLVSCSGGESLMSGAERIVFLGDSITEQGDHPGGYVALVRDSLQRAAGGRRPEIIGAGVSGNKVPDLLERVDRSVIALKPSIVVIYIGINDLWHFVLHNDGTPKDKYETGLKLLITKITATGAKVILCTPSVVGERNDGANPLDGMLDEYADISRSVARHLDVHLCDLRRAFIDYLKKQNPENRTEGVLTTDSVHLNSAGNRLVAQEMLRALAQ